MRRGDFDSSEVALFVGNLRGSHGAGHYIAVYQDVFRLVGVFESPLKLFPVDTGCQQRIFVGIPFQTHIDIPGRQGLQFRVARRADAMHCFFQAGVARFRIIGVVGIDVAAIAVGVGIRTRKTSECSGPEDPVVIEIHDEGQAGQDFRIAIGLQYSFVLRARFLLDKIQAVFLCDG